MLVTSSVARECRSLPAAGQQSVFLLRYRLREGAGVGYFLATKDQFGFPLNRHLHGSAQDQRRHTVGGIPSNYTVEMSLDLVSPVELAGIPSSYQLDITSLPKIQIGLDPITINPMDLSVAITQIPSIRAHIPAHFAVGFSIFGFQLASIQLCGEAQVITEPYVPNPCEPCGAAVFIAPPSPPPNRPVTGGTVGEPTPQASTRKRATA
jgi:hypothetical protein